MKGVIVKCLEDMVVRKYGRSKWEKSLEDSGVMNAAGILTISDVPDENVIKILSTVCKNLGISIEEAADAFGHHWVFVYSQRLYSHYYKASKTAKEFILNMNDLHFVLTKSMKNAHPPKFVFDWKDEKTLLLKYESKRNMIDFSIGLLKAIGEYYHEKIDVIKLGRDRIQVVFS